MSDTAELIATVGTIVGALTHLDVPYFVTGSLASSVRGEFRATNDIDIVATLEASKVVPLCAQLSGEFVADLDQARAALSAGAGFNLIHRQTYLKVDIFPCVSAFDREATRRAGVITLPQGTAPVRVATTEDILLAKLRWYRLGGETSDTQRRDIEGLVALNRPELDEPYLRHWATQLGVADLLEPLLNMR